MHPFLAPESTGKPPCHCIEPMPALFLVSEYGTDCMLCGGHLSTCAAMRAMEMRISRALDAAGFKPSGIAGLDVRELS